MASDRMRALLDNLAKSKDQELARLRAGNATPAATDNPLGLRFAHGARVLDVSTGVAGVVTREWRESATGGEHYFVRLDDGRLLPRASSELEPHPAPELPFGK